MNAFFIIKIVIIKVTVIKIDLFLSKSLNKLYSSRNGNFSDK